MPYDLVIKGGTIVDGTGAARFQGDVAVAQGKIVEIGKSLGGARQVIDASDLVVAPGFVDPLVSGHRIEPAFQFATAVPKMEFSDAALTDALDEFVRIGQIAGECHREAAKLREKADQIASDVDGCYRRGHGRSREVLEVVTLAMPFRK